jgi:hypothetical protein
MSHVSKLRTPSFIKRFLGWSQTRLHGSKVSQTSGTARSYTGIKITKNLKKYKKILRPVLMTIYLNIWWDWAGDTKLI